MDAIETLMIEREMHLTLVTFCDIVDSKEYDRFHEVFTADCVGDYRQANGKHFDGLAPFVEHMKRNLGHESNCGPSHHNVFNLRARIAGAEAFTNAHYYAVHLGVRAAAGQTYKCWGEYRDDWIRTPSGWRISRRIYSNWIKEGSVEVVRSAEAIRA